MLVVIVAIQYVLFQINHIYNFDVIFEESYSINKMKIIYKYWNKWYEIETISEELQLLVSDNILFSKNLYMWHPNDEIDDKIREYVDEDLKKQPFYLASHADEIIIENKQNNKQIHRIKDYLSDNNVQEIINNIKNND